METHDLPISVLRVGASWLCVSLVEDEIPFKGVALSHPKISKFGM
jgi:hypothetical protein